MKSLFLPVILLLCSCAAMKKSAVHDLDNGFYTVQRGDTVQKAYAAISESDIRLYRSSGNQVSGELPFFTFSLDPCPSDTLAGPLVLKRRSADLDITTILLKFRFPRAGVPAQLNSSFNAALYLGYRHDFFRFRDRIDPLGRRTREQHHFEFDFGPFAGIGAAAINPTTTSGLVNEEYDGVIWQKGLAAFIGSGNFSVGIGIGFDGLLNRHRHQWIYQEKPWLGILVGLNLTN